MAWSMKRKMEYTNLFSMHICIFPEERNLNNKFWIKHHCIEYMSIRVFTDPCSGILSARHSTHKNSKQDVLYYIKFSKPSVDDNH